MANPRAPWWMYIVAASFLGCFALLSYSVFREVQHLGIDPEYVSGGMILREVAPGSPAEHAGLRQGDVVVAVDGHAIRSRLDWEVISANFEPSRAMLLEVERAGKRFELGLTLRRQSLNDWNRATFLEAVSKPYTLRIVQLSLLLIACVIAFSRPHDFIARLGALYLAGASVTWVEAPYGFAATWRHLPPLVGGLLWPAVVGAAAVPLLLFTFFAIFPRPLFRARWVWALVWAPGLVAGYAFFLHLYRMVYYPESALGAPGWASPAAFSVVLPYILGGPLALVMNYRRLEDVNDRRRLRVLAVGLLLGFPLLFAVTALVLLGATSGVVESFLLSAPVVMLAVIFFMAVPLSFAIAILRHRLFDIRVVVRQGLQYALARGVLFAIVPTLAVIMLADVLLHGDQPLIAIMSARGWVYGALGGLAYLANLKRQSWLQALDRRFFRERYDAQRILKEVVEQVHRAGSFEKVAPRVVAKIEAALHPEFAALLVREPQEKTYRTLAAAPSGQAPPPLRADSKLVTLARVLGKPLEVSLRESGWLKQQLPHEETDFLRQARIDLLVPIVVAAERAEALLALGAKRSEEPYSREDQDLLVAIASSLALLLEKPTEVARSARRVSEAFEECPECGTCYDTGAGRCRAEGTKLISMHLPRVLAGRYRLEKRRGRGGMGTVYEATDAALERRVALKVIREGLLSSAEAAERFRREARAAASFTHPNVVTVHDFGVADHSRAFLVMELLEGMTLRDELKQKSRLSASRALDILRGVCAAVEAGHRRQLIHHDLKPENIFLARDDTEEATKVVDFGLAKFLPAATQATADTATGALVGTLAYMSPEELRGLGIGVAWDLWALAVVAYEMLTGVQPFPRATAILMGRFTPLTEYLPDAPSRWQGFFAQAFALDPNLRPSSARIFHSELKRALG